MKRCLSSLVVITFLCSACVTTSTTDTVQSFGGFKEKVCPSLLLINTELSAIPNLDAKVKEDISEITPLISSICTADLVTDTSNIRSFLKSGFPLLTQIVLNPAVSATPQGQTLLFALPIVSTLFSRLIP